MQPKGITRSVCLLALLGASAGLLAAGPVTPATFLAPDTYSIDPIGSGCICTEEGLAYQLLDGGQSLKLYTTGPIDFVSGINEGGGGQGMMFSWYGSGAGTFANPTFHASWSFNTDTANGDSVDWILRFTLNENKYDLGTGTTGAGGGPVTGSVDIPLPVGTDFLSWSATLGVRFTHPAGVETRLTVDVPPNSIDPTFGTASVPEPGTFGLLGLALVAGACSLRRRKA